MLLSAKTACLNGIETKIMLSFTALHSLSGFPIADFALPADHLREHRPYSSASTVWRANP